MVGRRVHVPKDEPVRHLHLAHPLRLLRLDQVEQGAQSARGLGRILDAADQFPAQERRMAAPAGEHRQEDAGRLPGKGPGQEPNRARAHQRDVHRQQEKTVRGRVQPGHAGADRTVHAPGVVRVVHHPRPGRPCRAPDLVVPVTGDHHHLVDPGRAEQADAQTKRGLCPLRVERQERLEPTHARTQAGRQHQRAQARCHALRPVARW